MISNPRVSEVTVNDLIIKACAKALEKYPKFNAYLEDDAIRLNQSINIGVAIAQEEGLIVPAIMDCGDKSLRDIASASKDLAARATSGSLQTQEYTGGTFAISNLGMFDVTSFAAIIHPPQTAVVAVGTVDQAPRGQGRPDRDSADDDGDTVSRPQDRRRRRGGAVPDRDQGAAPKPLEHGRVGRPATSAI